MQNAFICTSFLPRIPASRIIIASDGFQRDFFPPNILFLKLCPVPSQFAMIRSGKAQPTSLKDLSCAERGVCLLSPALLTRSFQLPSWACEVSIESLKPSQQFSIREPSSGSLQSESVRNLSRGLQQYLLRRVRRVWGVREHQSLRDFETRPGLSAQ